MNPIVEVNVQSEIGKLNGVIIHTPGEEVENMTPENAERALYSDIINLSIARKEYKQNFGSFIVYIPLINESSYAFIVCNKSIAQIVCKGGVSSVVIHTSSQLIIVPPLP